MHAHIYILMLLHIMQNLSGIQGVNVEKVPSNKTIFVAQRNEETMIEPRWC